MLYDRLVLIADWASQPTHNPLHLSAYPPQRSRWCDSWQPLGGRYSDGSSMFAFPSAALIIVSTCSPLWSLLCCFVSPRRVLYLPYRTVHRGGGLGVHPAADHNVLLLQLQGWGRRSKTISCWWTLSGKHCEGAGTGSVDFSRDGWADISPHPCQQHSLPVWGVWEPTRSHCRHTR